jgi:ribosomal protein S18 acetylase RimI-like enzyme
VADLVPVRGDRKSQLVLTNADMQIRLATSADAEAITSLYMQSAEHHASLDPKVCRVPDRATVLRRYQTGGQHPIPGSHCITLVAEAAGEIVGFMDARVESQFDPMLPPTPYCYVAEIGVHTAHRGQGFGEQLMRAIEEWGRSRGAGYVVLEYNNRNTRAAAFYDRIGYEPVSTSAIKWL